MATTEIRERREELLTRIPRLQLAFMLLLVAIGSTYWFVQVVRGDHYRELAEHNRLRRETVKAPRGLIFDRRDRLLVENVPSYNLLLDESRAADLEGSLRFAAATLGVDAEGLRERLRAAPRRARFTPALIAENLSLSEVARLSAASLEHPEFETEVAQLRLYRHGPMTAHLLGHLGEVTEADLSGPESVYAPGDLAGRRGVERAYEQRLRGTDGERQVVVDSWGRAREEFGSEAARAGESLQLTLDLDLQQLAARYFEERVGAAVALDPRTGDILAMVSAPSYNPNLFARRLDRQAWQRLIDAPHDPLQNRALQNTYSPGSIFKIVIATAGLGEHVMEADETVYCGGSTRIYNRRFRCWKQAGHGRVDLRRAIKESCDVYFYHLGQKLGIERIADYARRFGLGVPTGIPISGEKTGLVPDPEWSLRTRQSAWYPGETISVAIGQGPLLATPLQMAAMMSVVANGGRRVVPRLDVAAPLREHEQSGLDPQALARVREALWAVVNERGTGASARVAGFDVAGKTGTAQVIEQATWVDSADLPYEQRDHAWFASFAPVENPALVVVVFVEHGGKGSAAAAPLARMIYERFRDHSGYQGPA